MRIFRSILAAPWNIPPAMPREAFLLHVVEAAVQTIWLHHASCASPADLALMPETLPKAELLQSLEYGITRVRLQVCRFHELKQKLYSILARWSTMRHTCPLATGSYSPFLSG